MQIIYLAHFYEISNFSIESMKRRTRSEDVDGDKYLLRTVNSRSGDNGTLGHRNRFLLMAMLKRCRDLGVAGLSLL